MSLVVGLTGAPSRGYSVTITSCRHLACDVTDGLPGRAGIGDEAVDVGALEFTGVGPAQQAGIRGSADQVQTSDNRGRRTLAGARDHGVRPHGFATDSQVIARNTTMLSAAP